MSAKFVMRPLTLAASERKRVNEVASFFMLVSNTGALDVRISIDNEPLSDIPVGYEYREPKPDSFYSHIDFYNPNVAPITIVYVMSIGIVRSSPALVGLDAIVDVLSGILIELQGNANGELWDTEKTIGVAQSEVMALNGFRHTGIVQAKSTNTGIIYIGYDNTVTLTKWIAELQAGQSFCFDDWRGPIHAIATIAGQKLGFGEH